MSVAALSIPYMRCTLIEIPCRIWKENSIAKKFSPHAAELYRSAFTLRQRMMNAVQNLEYYMMIEIIEPNWHIFIEKMKNVENVDMVLSLHQDFLDLCLKNCMLTETSHLNRAIFKLCKICLKFCEFIQVRPGVYQYKPIYIYISIWIELELL